MSELSKKYHRVHFIGIGGIGVSALAQWFLAQGAKVTGSNLSEELILALLRKRGARVKIGAHSAKNVPKNAELIIYTLAAPKDNPERKEARRRGIRQMSYPEAVGELTKNKFTIAICGAHGKSTTTALTALTLIKAGLDPTVFVGTTIKEFGGSNFRHGRSKYLVLEADEWGGAFWNYHPDIAIWTTVDREHLDFYKNFSGVQAGFKKFLMNLKNKGAIIANGDNPSIRKAVRGMRKRHYFYSLANPEVHKIRRIIQIPGEHNVSNALSTLKLAHILHIPQSKALEAIGDYRGAWRRFEYKGNLNGAPVYDDYGHHPTEIKATLAAAKAKIPDCRLWCAYQPHQYQRTKYLFNDFARAFGDADVVVLMNIYNVAGRERRALTRRMDSVKLAQAIREQGRPVVWSPTPKDAAELLRVAVQPNDVVIIMGAGDIWKIYNHLNLS